MPADQHERLLRAQWKIDQVRSLAKNPVDAMNRVGKLMWDELIKLKEHQKRLVETFHTPVDRQDNSLPPVAKILPFKVSSKD
jgi:hypothetical protein